MGGCVQTYTHTYVQCTRIKTSDDTDECVLYKKNIMSFVWTLEFLCYVPIYNNNYINVALWIRFFFFFYAWLYIRFFGHVQNVKTVLVWTVCIIRSVASWASYFKTLRANMQYLTTVQNDVYLTSHFRPFQIFLGLSVRVRETSLTTGSVRLNIDKRRFGVYFVFTWDKILKIGR